MNAPVYRAHGPVRAQDGRSVYVVVRCLEAPPDATPAPRRAVALAECLTLSAAEQHAQALNDAADKAAALTLP